MKQYVQVGLYTLFFVFLHVLFSCVLLSNFVCMLFVCVYLHLLGSVCTVCVCVCVFRFCPDSFLAPGQ